MHCKDVCVRKVSIPLNEENISSLMKDWRAYKRAEYIVLVNGNDHSVVRIEKEGTGLIRKVSDFKIISLPKDTVYIERPKMDVLNIPALAKVQTEYPGKTVVVKGLFSHISFVKDMIPFELTVVDNTPPTPSKLGELVKIALNSGFIEYPVVIKEFVDISMEERIKDVKTEAVMFPCAVSGLSSDRPYYFLDEAPEVKGDVTLIGCHLSERIYTELYGKGPKLINVCPADHTEGRGRCIVKCCLVKQDHVIDGNIVKVPWGATVPEVVEAIKDIYEQTKP